MPLKDVLEDIGLTEKEAKVYLTLLELKEALPSVISKHSGVKRPTTYLILEQLVKKGLAGRAQKGKFEYFQATSPSTLVENQSKKLDALHEALPKLLQLHERFAVRPQMSIFEGEQGLIHIMEDTLTTSTELLCWVNLKLATGTLLEEYYPTYIQKKVERKLWLRGIFSFDEVALEFKKKGAEELREVYLIPNEEFPFKNEINIYDDKVAIISHPDKVGIIIQNQNIADTQRSIFNFAFRCAQRAEEMLFKEKGIKPIPTPKAPKDKRA